MGEFKEVAPSSENPYFKVLVTCSAKQGQVKTAIDGHTKIDQHFTRLNEENWQTELEEAKRKGAESANKKQMALSSVDISGETVNIHLLETDWKTFRFTRSPKIRESFGNEYMADILGCNVVIRTKDNKLLFVRRGLKGYKPGAASTVGGYPDVESDVDAEGNWDPFKTISRELEEETSIRPDDITNLVLSGVIYNKDQRNANLAFYADVNLTESQLRQELASGSRKTDKEVDLKFIPDTEQELRNLSLWYALANSPAGISTLAFYAREKYGNRLYDLIMSRLNARSQKYGTLSQDQKIKMQQKASDRLGRFSSIKLQD